MLRFYSPAWVDAFNEAVAQVELAPDAVGELSVAAAAREVRVAQVVHGAPGSPEPLVVTLVLSGGRLRLQREDDDGASGTPTAPGGPDDAVAPAPDVAMSLDYADAADLSRGVLAPAEAIATGRVRVRGDLSVLVAVHRLLAAAAASLAPLSAATDYGE